VGVVSFVGMDAHRLTEGGATVQALAGFVLLATFVGSLWIGTYQEFDGPFSPGSRAGYTPDWAPPVAAGVGVGGVLLALLIYRQGQWRFTPPRFVATAAIIGVATAAIGWVATYKIVTPLARALVNTHWDYHTFAVAEKANHSTALTASPHWATPAAALIGIAAIGAAMLVLRYPLRRSPAPESFRSTGPAQRATS
jgi:hypothetical protein